MFAYLTAALFFTSIIAPPPRQSGICGDSQITFDYHYFNSIANNKIADLDSIDVGRIIKFPHFTYSKKTHTQVSQVRIKSDDTLWDISQNHYLNIKYSNRLTPFYIIQSGDYLYKIAEYFVKEDQIDEAVKSLVAINSIEDPDSIDEGGLLKLPKEFKSFRPGFNPSKKFARIVKCR